jgi:hypothetical protein
MANDPNITTAAPPPPPAGFVPDSQAATASTAPPPPPGFVPDSQSQATSQSSSQSSSQPGAFSRFVSGALDEAKGAVTGAVQTAGQVAKAVVNPPQDAHETIAYNVGGPGGLAAYRAAQKIVGSAQDMVRLKMTLPEAPWICITAIGVRDYPTLLRLAVICCC